MERRAYLLLRCWPLKFLDNWFLFRLDADGLVLLYRKLVARLRLNYDGEQALFPDVVFFVRFYDVVDQGTIFWQEETWNLQRLAVPHLWGPDFDVLLWTFLLFHLGGLEPNFCANAEIGDHVENYFFEHSVFWELLENIRLSVQFVWVHWSKIHYISDVEIVYPVVVVFHAKGIADINLELSIRL